MSSSLRQYRSEDRTRAATSGVAGEGLEIGEGADIAMRAVTGEARVQKAAMRCRGEILLMAGGRAVRAALLISRVKTVGTQLIFGHASIVLRSKKTLSREVWPALFFIAATRKGRSRLIENFAEVSRKRLADVTTWYERRGGLLPSAGEGSGRENGRTTSIGGRSLITRGRLDVSGKQERPITKRSEGGGTPAVMPI